MHPRKRFTSAGSNWLHTMLLSTVLGKGGLAVDKCAIDHVLKEGEPQAVTCTVCQRDFIKNISVFWNSRNLRKIIMEQFSLKCHHCCVIIR